MTGRRDLWATAGRSASEPDARSQDEVSDATDAAALTITVETIQLRIVTPNFPPIFDLSAVNGC